MNATIERLKHKAKARLLRWLQPEGQRPIQYFYAPDRGMLLERGAALVRDGEIEALRGLANWRN